MTATKTPLYRKAGNSYTRVYCEKANWKECREHKNDIFALPAKATILEFTENYSDTITVEDYISENRTGTGLGGIEYENQILSTLTPLQSKGLLKVIKEESAGFSAHGSDLELELKGLPFNIEVKKDLAAQMGGGIIDFDAETNKLTAKGNLLSIDALILKEIMELAETKTPAITNYINFIKSIDPDFDIYNASTGIPLKTSVKNRDQAKKQGYLKAINGIVSTDTTFMEQHYNAKNTYYIQIGKAGLFYMGSNPHNLPIPRLQGIINVEFRLGYAGTKFGVEGNYRAANLRVQARIKSKLASPYTLDDPKSVKKLLKDIK